MAKPDDAALAAALRDNLKRRKERMRAAMAEGAPAAIKSHGADEEGDIPPSERPGAWAREGSKQRP